MRLRDSMHRVFADQVGREGFAPRIRSDLRWENRGHSSFVVVTTPSGRKYQLNEAEWSVALQMDGVNTIDMLLEHVRALHPRVTRDKLEAFVDHLAQSGLLEAED